MPFFACVKLLLFDEHCTHKPMQNSLNSHYERMPSTPRHGYGVTLHASAYMPLLDIWGLDEFTFRCRIAVDGSLGGNGNIEPKFMVYSGKINPTSFRAHREKLENLLREGLNIQWEHSLEKVEETSSGMALFLQNGQRIESSCVVGADGPHSNTRKSLSPDTPFGILPYVAFNGKRRVKRALFDSTYAPAFKDSNVLETKIDDLVLSLSVNEQQADAVSMSWILSHLARGSTDPLHKPNRLVSGATDIPEEFFYEVQSLSIAETPCLRRQRPSVKPPIPAPMMWTGCGGIVTAMRCNILYNKKQQTIFI
ncbi:hypothetical protein GGI43DRAFT_346614 [Trichoderma evansii]